MSKTATANHRISHWIGVDLRWKLYGPNPIPHLVSITPRNLSTHGLLIGATGSGKTTALHHLIAQDIRLGHSFIVFDLRGDLINGVLELCAGHVDPNLIRMIDLREKRHCLGFNPLSGAGEPYFRALNVLDVLASEAESWGVQLGETLRNALLLLSEAGAALPDLEALLYEQEVRERLLERCETESVRSFWERYGAQSRDRQAALAMPVLNKVSLLLSTSTLRSTLGHPAPLNLGVHLDTHGSILLVSLAADELHEAGRKMGSLVLSSICREIFARVNQPEGSRNPVRLYVDEFEHFGMRDFEAILAEGRRFKLSLVLAHQTLAQLTPRIRSMILGNVGCKVVFRCGREDSATLSRDIFDDSRGYDFTKLMTGQAVLWRREDNTVELEVCAPLLHNVGALSADAEALRRASYQSADVRRTAHTTSRRVQPSTRPDRAQKPSAAYPSDSSPRANPDLEDWL